MNIKIFADGAVIGEMIGFHDSGKIHGFTTNPTLMRKSGIDNYEEFAKEVLRHIRHAPISFEVFSDDFGDMRRQAIKLSQMGDNVYVKIPITNTKNETSLPLIEELANMGIKLNVTAIMTEKQVSELCEVLKSGVPSIVSVFAGRIADTGVDPVPVMKRCLQHVKRVEKSELLWASPREVLNVYQAEEIGCHIITATTPILNKLALRGKALEEYSLETVKMFRNDALSAGYIL
jgi:transaldolase